MNILVMGGTGAMGKHLVPLLAEQNHSVYVTSRKKYEDSKNIFYLKGDARNLDFLIPILNKKWDCIVDFMIYSTEEFKNRHELLLSSTNQYVFFSSSRVYADSKTPITENSPRLLDVCKDEEYLKTDEYALAKAREENILFESKFKNWTIIRPYITYSENRLQLGVHEKENWLFTALNAHALVFSKDIAKHITTLTYGKDVARGIASIIGKENALSQAFHITGNNSIKWEKVFDIYAETLEENGIKIEKILKEKTYRLEGSGKYQVIYDRYFDRVFDNSKIAEFIDISTFKTPEEGLKECLKEFLKNKEFNYTDVYGGGVFVEEHRQTLSTLQDKGGKSENKIPFNKDASLLRKVYRKLKRTAKNIGKKFTKTKISPLYVPVLEGKLLENRFALITGGTSGIGFAIAESFLKNGATIVITSRSNEKVQNAVLELEQKDEKFKGRIFGLEMDSKDVNSFEEKFSDVLKFCKGKIDILVNNAGIIKGNFGSLKEEDFDLVLGTNLKGAYFLSQVVANYMKDNCIKGNILNVASSSSLRPAVSPYTLSKWGLRGLTLGLAKILIPYGIVVNGIAPGPTATPMLTQNVNDLFLKTSPTQRYATAEEIANLATVLVSNLGKMVVGDVLYATGGAGLITFDDIKYGF